MSNEKQLNQLLETFLESGPAGCACAVARDGPFYMSLIMEWQMWKQEG